MYVHVSVGYYIINLNQITIFTPRDRGNGSLDESIIIHPVLPYSGPVISTCDPCPRTGPHELEGPKIFNYTLDIFEFFYKIQVSLPNNKMQDKTNIKWTRLFIIYSARTNKKLNIELNFIELNFLTHSYITVQLWNRNVIVVVQSKVNGDVGLISTTIILCVPNYTIKFEKK